MDKNFIFATPTAGQAPLTVTFSATFPALIEMWEWGDGASEGIGAGAPEYYYHTYAEAGVYTVKLRTGGFVDYKTITVLPIPEIHTPITFEWISPIGITLTFNRDAWDYKLLKTYDGLAIAPVSHNTVKAPYQDGTTRTGTQLNAREISFTVLVQSSSIAHQQQLIRELAAAFNPLNGEGVLVYTQEDGTEYRLTCIGNNTPTLSTTDRSDVHQVVTIDLIAHDPFWYSNAQYQNTLEGTSTTFFPFGFDPTVVGGFSLGQNSDTTVLKNQGFVSAPVTISFIGEMTDPVITNNTTGEFIGLDLIMAAGDTFVVTTGFGNKTATYTSSGAAAINGFRYLDPESTFWQLVPGDNEILLSDASIAVGSQVRISWRDRFVGV